MIARLFYSKYKRTREVCLHISRRSEKPRYHLTNTTLAVQEPTCPTHSSFPRIFIPFITAPVRQGSKQSPDSPKTWVQIVSCIQQPGSPLCKSSLNEGTPVQHTPMLFFLYARWSDVGMTLAPYDLSRRLELLRHT